MSFQCCGGETDEHKSQVFGIQTTRGVHNGSDHYGIRSVRSGSHLHIRNLTPEATFSCIANQGEIWDGWVREAENGDGHAASLVRDYQRRPAEELYDVRKDAWNRKNLINEPSLAEVRAALHKKPDTWMGSQGDEGNATELRAREHMAR